MEQEQRKKSDEQTEAERPSSQLALRRPHQSGDGAASSSGETALLRQLGMEYLDIPESELEFDDPAPVLGRGAFGIVTLGRFRGTPVAVKSLLPEVLGNTSRAAVVQGLLSEIALLARLRHPNIVQCLGKVTGEGKVQLVMEFVEGGTLHDALAAGALPEAEAVVIIRGILCGLAALHYAGFAHRDLRPSNILLGRDRSVKLADFGLSKRVLEDNVSAEVTATVLRRGIDRYLAPEAMEEGGRADRPSDMYAVGLLIWEIVTGTPPYALCRNEAQLVTKVLLRGERPDAERLAPDLARFLAGCWDKNPGARPSAREALRAFDSIEAGVRASVAMRPPSK